MSQIKDYLEAGRANKVYDPNQGLYIDPDTGKTFVPTFTNVQTSNIQGQVEQSMGGGGQVQADPYLVSDRPQQGAMPGASMPGAGQKPKGPDARDPWAMANEHMKSSGFKTEIYRQIFGDRDPSQGFQSKQERDVFFKALQSNRNMLVDRFKWQITQSDKDKAAENKRAGRGVDQKDYYKNIQEARARLSQARSDSMIEDPSGASWDAESGGRDVNEMAREEVENILRDFSSFTGATDDGSAMPGRESKIPDKTAEAMPTDKGDGVGIDAESSIYMNTSATGKKSETVDFKAMAMEDPAKGGKIYRFLNAVAEEVAQESDRGEFIRKRLVGGVSKELEAHADKYDPKKPLNSQDFFSEIMKKFKSRMKELEPQYAM